MYCDAALAESKMGNHCNCLLYLAQACMVNDLQKPIFD